MRVHRMQTALAVVGMLTLVPVAVSGCACSAVMYLNTGAIEVILEKALEPGSVVLGCFGSDCEPTEVDGSDSDGRTFEVPQEEPYVVRDQMELSPPRELRIQIISETGVVEYDEVLDVTTLPDNQFSFSSCPGPFHYDPVRVNNA